MIENFQLVAIVKTKDSFKLLRIPMHQELQEALTNDWQNQYDNFIVNTEEIPFDLGYQPNDDENFVINDYNLPDFLAQENSQTIQSLDQINNDEEVFKTIKGIAAFAREGNNEIILFQNFTRSRVILPGRFIFLQRDTYQTLQHPGLTFDKKLSAVYYSATKKLLFHSFRTINTFLPLLDFYKEASDQEIREMLNHDKLAPEDIDAISTEATIWFRKRFAMLRDLKILDRHSAEDIKNRSDGYDIDIKLENGKIVFPADKQKAKKLLQFMCEEIYRGPITDTLYETNSKKKAGS